jgi:hypothetical protein
VNGDGVDDVIVGAPGDFFYDSAGRSLPNAGRAYVLLGTNDARRGPAQLGAADDDTLVSSLEPARGRIDGGHGLDTLRPAASGPLALERAWPGTGATLPLDPTPDTAGARDIDSIEVIDLALAATSLVIDDAAVRALPQSRAGLPFDLAKSLVILGGADDSISIDLTPYEQVGMNEGRLVYRRIGAYYGFELSPAIAVIR